MKRSKESKDMAEKALARAIAEGNAQLLEDLAKANRRIAFLEAQLARVEQIARAAKPADAALPEPLATILRPQHQEPAQEEGQKGTLSPQDNMGDGRWA